MSNIFKKVRTLKNIKNDYDESMDKLEYLTNIIGEKRAKQIHKAMRQIKRI